MIPSSFEPLMLTRLPQTAWVAVNLRQADYFKWTADEVCFCPNAAPAARAAVRCLDFHLVGESRFFVRLANKDKRAAPLNVTLRLLRVEGRESVEVLRRDLRLHGGASVDVTAEFEPSHGLHCFELAACLDEGSATAWTYMIAKWPTLHHESVVLVPRRPPLVDSDAVVVGKQGWLFLTNDTNENIAQLLGVRRLSTDEASAWRLELERRAALFTKCGVRHAMLIAPNKETVCPHYLPDYLRPSPEKLGDRLMALAPAGFNLLYPKEALSVPSAYCATDTHWTDCGALIAARAVLHSLDMPTIEDEEVTLVGRLTAGDLGGKCVPNVVGSITVGRYKDDEAVKVFDNKLGNTGRVVVYRKPSRAKIVLLVFGDSFAHSLMAWLKERFGYTFFFHSSSIDADIVDALKPDIVITEIVERFIISPPKPLGTWSYGEDIHKKLSWMKDEALQRWREDVEIQGSDGDPLIDPIIKHHLFVASSLMRALAPVPSRQEPSTQSAGANHW